MSGLKINDLWIDMNQGVQRDGRAFGFVGTDWLTESDGQDCEYCGWFFSWPGAWPILASAEELEAVIDSLELDETASHRPQIPYELAEAALRARLEKNLARHGISN